MNKRCFRVVFSKTLQRFIVASELAKSKGKSNKASGELGLVDLQISAQIKPLVFSLFCLLGFVVFSNNVLAETLIIQADKTAPKNQQPIILQTANGLPQINIQTPNEKGLSHNKYSQFNVDTKGAILNNSRTNAQTQQAGWVQGNPYLARGEAKVILNEVNSPNPSVLKGYVEVAGKKAEVIIANPSGLHCEGCGVINASRATLTTGQPQVKNGHLDGFVVEKGKVSIEGKGLDNSKADYTEILSREVKANAGVWADKGLKVVTGKNHIKRSDTTDNLQIIHTNPPLAEDNSPQFAVDVGELGGMYAGKIHLIGTEAGVGVRNAGHIGASSDTLHIDSQGRIINTGTLNANQAVSLTASKGIENTGKIENRQESIRLTTQADIKQDGSVVARGGDIHKKATKAITQRGETVAKGNITYTAPTIQATTDSLLAAGVTITDNDKGETRQLDTQSAEGKSIQLTSSEKITAQGKSTASGDITLSAKIIDANDSQKSANTISVIATTGNIDAARAIWSANDKLNIHTPTTFSTVGGEFNAYQWKVSAARVDNQAGRWFAVGNVPLTLDLPQGLNNLGGVIQNQGNIDIHTHTAGIDNQQGIIKSLKGSISTQSATPLLNNQGKLIAGKTLSINHFGLNNQQGYILAQQGNATIKLHQNSLVNQHGNILAGEHLNITSGTLTNLQGTLYSGKNTTIHTHSGELNNQEQGKVIAGGDISLQAQQIWNDSGIIEAKNNATLTVTEQLDNQKSTTQGSLVQASNTLSISAQKLDNSRTKTTNILPESGLVTSTLNVTTLHLDNHQGGIYTLVNNTLWLTTLLNNQQGEIRSTGDLHIQGNALSVENQQGVSY